MKYLILLLFITSCTDKKVTAEPVVIEPEPVVASYDVETKLIKLLYNIYWNSSNNQYYGTKMFIPTNNIEYNFSQIKATNHFYYTNEPTLMEEEYQYVGSISLLERVYIDTNNPPQQYLKILKAIDDSVIICYDKKKFLNTLPVYPYTITLYTNTIDEQFYRIDDYILTPVEPNEFRYKDDLIEI